MSNKSAKSFNQLLNRLNEIAELLENDTIELEESIKLYEEGINISKVCITQLKTAELKVAELKQSVSENN